MSPTRSPATNSLMERLFAPAGSPLPPPRLLAVFAHPDDEVLALGGRLERMTHSRLLCATDGAPADNADMRAHGFTTRAQYRDARRAELHAALALAGVPASCSAVLELSPGVTVADQAASRNLTALARAIRREIDAFHPEAVLTHPYEGGHPDHDSCAFAVHIAVHRLPGRAAPPVVEAPSYFSRGALQPGAQGIVTGRFLPVPALQTDVLHFTLTPEEQRRKRERLACFASQMQTLAQFGTETELFRPAPDYDFLAPPHAGPVFYDAFPWGTSSSRFRELVAASLAPLERR